MFKIVVFEDNLLLVEVSGRRITKIELKDVIYFESNKRLVNIIYKSKVKDTIYMKLNELEKMLPNYFVRCHQSYIVNLKRIDKFQDYKFSMQNRRNN